MVSSATAPHMLMLRRLLPLLLLLLQLAHEHGRLFAALQQAQEKLVRYCCVRATQKKFYTHFHVMLVDWVGAARCAR